MAQQAGPPKRQPQLGTTPMEDVPSSVIPLMGEVQDHLPKKEAAHRGDGFSRRH